MNEAQKTNGSLALGGQSRVITIPASEAPQNRRLRVAAYARVSSGSEDQKHSFAAQTAYYTDLITGNQEWDFVDVYKSMNLSPTPPAPVRSANGVELGQLNVNAMTESQFVKLNDLLKMGGTIAMGAENR